jgi:hypothetical protein
MYTEKFKLETYLRFTCSLVVAVNGTRGRAGSSQVPTLGQALFSLGFPDLNLLLLATTPELIGLEDGFRLVVAAVLGDISFRHIGKRLSMRSWVDVGVVVVVVLVGFWNEGRC